MGRSSTSGMVYLVKRPESGFSYIRDLPTKVCETLSGELALSWSADRRKVGGRKILKIALGTSDLALARQRWLEVHPQVENLIGFAKDTFQRRRTRSTTTTRIRSLPREAIKQIAEDVYQRILASDDEAISGRPADRRRSCSTRWPSAATRTCRTSSMRSARPICASSII